MSETIKILKKFHIILETFTNDDLHTQCDNFDRFRYVGIINYLQMDYYSSYEIQLATLTRLVQFSRRADMCKLDYMKHFLATLWTSKKFHFEEDLLLLFPNLPLSQILEDNPYIFPWGYAPHPEKDNELFIDRLSEELAYLEKVRMF